VPVGLTKKTFNLAAGKGKEKEKSEGENEATWASLFVGNLGIE
jgi:hypothetical protein